MTRREICLKREKPILKRKNMEIFVYYNDKEDIYFLDPISKNSLLNKDFNLLFNKIALNKGYNFLYGIFIPINLLLNLYEKDPEAFPYGFHLLLKPYIKEDDTYE